MIIRRMSSRVWFSPVVKQTGGADLTNAEEKARVSSSAPWGYKPSKNKAKDKVRSFRIIMQANR